MNKKFYEGYEGEDAVRIWTGENSAESGIIVWRGIFEVVLDGCYQKDFSKGGFIECYCNQNGFYDNQWEMRLPMIVMHELAAFNEKNCDTRSEDLIREAGEFIRFLVAFINEAMNNDQKIYVEYT